PADKLSNLALMGDIRRLQLLANRGNVNRRDRWGQTPLLRAAWGGESGPNPGHKDCASLLLQLGADANVKDPDGVSALHWSAESDNLPVLKLLADAGARLDATDKRGLTPLMLASWRGHLRSARELLRLGCDPGVEDKDGDTAASLAEMYEHGDVVRLLADCVDTDDDLVEEEDHSESNRSRASSAKRNFVRQKSAAPVGTLKRPEMYRSSTSFMNRSLPVSFRHYPVKDPQGHCLIISIEHYDPGSHFTNRTGSELDVERVESLFTSLHFKVTVKRDLTAPQIFHEMSRIAKFDHSDYGTFICFLMAHGTKGAIYGRDGQFHQIKDLISLFKPNICKGLDGKP
uniref:CASPASE_P20 domain-containing protein n=1 Tax=Macrostomum lignano TaxID=282301 RepID=A0A1I8J6A3_9PLAT